MLKTIELKNIKPEPYLVLNSNMACRNSFSAHLETQPTSAGLLTSIALVDIDESGCLSVLQGWLKIARRTHFG
jgi:hypothetical protein